MKTLNENNGTIMGIYDEFSTFLDNLDKGTTGASEKGRYLSLFSAVDWSKKTKSAGSLNIKDPRFCMVSFTQPYYAYNFVQNSQHDGFFQRFLITTPKEVLVMIDEKLEMVEKSKGNLIEMSSIFQLIFDHCQNGNEIVLNKEAFNQYKIVHDEIVKFRAQDLFEDDKAKYKIKIAWAHSSCQWCY